MTLPGIKIDWDQVSPGGGEIFQYYNVWRRKRLGYRAAADLFGVVAYWRFSEEVGSVFLDEGIDDADGIHTNVTVNVPSLITGDFDDRAATYNGSTSRSFVADEAILQNRFDGGGAISGIVRVTSDGEGSQGHIFHKGGAASGWRFYVEDEAGGLVRFTFEVQFSTTDGIWQTVVDKSLAAVIPFVLSYDADDVANNPTLVLGQSVLTVGSGLTEAQTPVGVRVTDVGDDLIIGDSSDSDRSWDGEIDEPKFHSRELLDLESKFLNASSGGEVNALVRIAQITEITEITYLDRTVEAGVTYEYFVTWVAAVGVDLIESELSAFSEEFGIITGMFLYAVDNPDFQVEILGGRMRRFDEQDIRLLQPWGAERPVAHVGPLNKSQLTVNSAKFDWGTNRKMWDDLRTLQKRQGPAPAGTGALLCLRYRGDLYFCQMTRLDRVDQLPDLAEVRITLEEVEHSEAV